MKLITAKNHKEMSKKAAEIVVDEIKKKPGLAISFAAGNTPRRLYKILIKAYGKGEIDFSEVKAFNLDEYYPIKKSNKKSFYHYLFKNLFDEVNIKKSNINLLNGEAKNPRKECGDYEKKIRRSPIELQILGMGINGHIAFNEPGSDPNSGTRLVKLAPETIKADCPKKALTLGISTIMKSKKIILLASGKKKAEAVRCLVRGEIDKNCPASFLKKHKNLVIIIDRKAGSLLFTGKLSL